MNVGGYNYIVNLIEICILLIGFFSILILLYVIASVTEFHQNFRVLLFLLSGIFLLAILDFFFLVLSGCLEFEDGMVAKVLRIVHDVVTPSYTFAFTLLVVERFIATRWASVYEKHGNKYPQLLVLACAASIAFGISLSLVFHLSDRTQLQMSVILGILTVADASFFFMSLYLLHQNKRMFQAQFVAGTQSLTERYQITENIKLTRLLAPILIGEVVVNVISLAVIIYYCLILPYDPNSDYRIVGYIVDLDLGIFIAVFPWMIILRHPPYQRKFGSLLPIKALRISDHWAGITNVNGKVILIQQTAKTHFDILRRDWL